ncbi:MAG: helix-turn-helix transcriptional regulator [Ferruginibacter sp.]
MNSGFKLLSPVKEDEFRLTFGHTQVIENGINPVEIFATAIDHIKKMAFSTYFWFIADTVKWVIHASGGSLEKMMPIRESEFTGYPPDILFKNIHPEHVTSMFAFSNYWVSYFSALPDERKPYVKASMYLRMLNAKNNYNWFMIQYADNLIDDTGKIIYGLTVVTDISHIKREGDAMMSILDTYDDSCQQFLCFDGKSVHGNQVILPALSKREIEVLYYLAAGHSSKQIAAELNIALKTIDNHRQNMLRKTNTKSTGELVAFGINMGYI